MDLTTSEQERLQRAAFFRKIEQMKAAHQIVLECEKCLLIFSDVILHRMHISMHSLSGATWKCSMCMRHFPDRAQFHEHTVKFSHSLVPTGIKIPAGLRYRSGLPDLVALCSANLEGLAKIFGTFNDK